MCVCVVLCCVCVCVCACSLTLTPVFSGGFERRVSGGVATLGFFPSRLSGCVTALYVDGYNADFNTTETGVNVHECDVFSFPTV